MRMTFIDFFAGIGGFHSGFEKAGMKCIGWCEFDKFAQKSYRAVYETEGLWFADDVIQDLTDRAYAIYGEYAESFLEEVNGEQKEELECAINNVIQDWLDKHNLNVNAFLIEDVEQVKT